MACDQTQPVRPGVLLFGLAGSAAARGNSAGRLGVGLVLCAGRAGGRVGLLYLVGVGGRTTLIVGAVVVCGRGLGGTVGSNGGVCRECSLRHCEGVAERVGVSGGDDPRRRQLWTFPLMSAGGCIEGVSVTQGNGRVCGVFGGAFE